MNPNGNMTGKVCMVTGATNGIGKVTALELAHRGATVIVIGRNQERALSTVGEIRAATGNQAVDFLLADLASQSQIRSMANEYLRRYKRLDVLVNNAGAMYLWRQESPDGIELTWATNHLSYFLLTLLLLDLIKNSAPARIVNVSSNAQYGNPVDFSDLQNEKRYWFMRAYGRSKSANVLFTYELARRLEGTGVTANALHPGFVRTNMARNNGWLVRLLAPLVQISGISPQEGAQTSLYLACSPEVEDITGQFFVDKKAVQSDPATYNESAAKRLWQISAEMTSMARGGVND